MLEFIITEDVKELATLQLPDPSLMDYYNRLNNRELWINYDIDSSLVEFINNIILWNKEDKDIPIEDRKPIKIFINTDGGCLNSCMSFANILQKSTTPVITIGLGKVYSAGFLLLLAGHKRYILEYTEGLLHSGSFGISNSTEKIFDYIDHNKKVEEKVKEYVVSNTGISYELYNSNYRKEWYMLAQELVDLKVVDKIIDDLDEILH